MTSVERELRTLLDRFPNAALDLHSALVGNVLDGQSADGSTVTPRASCFAHRTGLDCGCAIGTVAESQGMSYDQLTAGAVSMTYLPALEHYVEIIVPDDIDPTAKVRRHRLIRYIERWMDDHE